MYMICTRTSFRIETNFLQKWCEFCLTLLISGRTHISCTNVYTYYVMHQALVELGYLSSSQETVGSSILLISITRCLTPAVLANIACSLYNKIMHMHMYINIMCLVGQRRWDFNP